MKKVLVMGMLLFWIFIQSKTVVYAEEVKDAEDYQAEMMEDIDLTEVQQVLDDISGDTKLDFREVLTQLMSGNTELSLELIKDLAFDQVFYEMNYNKNSILHIILIAVIAAIFTNFSNVFKNQQTSEVSFYMIYLLLITILVFSFETIVGSAAETIESITTFTKALAPAYAMSIAFASGGTTATAFYNILLFVIYLVNWLILNIILPLVNIYVILTMVNHLSKEDFLSKFADLIKTIVEWLLKSLLAVVVGFNIIQSMLAPVIDTVKTSVFSKAAEAMPGIGNAVNAVTDVVLGSAVLIKNGIGVAALVIILILCLVPLIKLVVFTLMYKFAAAIIQPISEKRMLGCVTGVGEGATLLLKVTASSAALFIITIAIVAASSS